MDKIEAELEHAARGQRTWLETLSIFSFVGLTIFFIHQGAEQVYSEIIKDFIVAAGGFGAGYGLRAR